MIYLFAGTLIAIVTVTLAWPALVRSSTHLGRNESALAMLHDQLGEVDRDLERGIIPADDARAARIEIQRRIIAVSQSNLSEDAKGASGSPTLLAAAVIVPVAAIALYFYLGSPNVPSLPFSDRTEEIAGAQEVDVLTIQLRERLLTDADGGPTDGWILLGETYMRIGRFSEAADAFEQILDRADVTSGIFSRHAEALVMAEGGLVTPKAERALNRSLELDPSNPAGTYYKALALEQAGALDAAYALLLARLDLADGFSPWMESYVSLANLLAVTSGAPEISLEDYAPILRQPSEAQIAMAQDMSEEDRSAFITSMVDRLATRLDNDPDDLDGWLQLAQAYTVLGRINDARNAYSRAAPLVVDLAPDDPRRQKVDQGLAD